MQTFYQMSDIVALVNKSRGIHKPLLEGYLDKKMS